MHELSSSFFLVFVYQDIILRFVQAVNALTITFSTYCQQVHGVNIILQKLLN